MKQINLLLLLVCSIAVQAQINPKNIDIVRDQWGVPHIYAETDAEVAYGLAWATAEDDFNSVQEHILVAKGRLAEVKGKEGAILDVVKFLLGIDELVDTAYHDKTYSTEFQKILKAYTLGLNNFAKKHPKKVLLKGLFPIQEKDLVKAYTLGFCLFSGVQNDLVEIFDGSIKNKEGNLSFGSNAIAISRRKTTDNKTYLAINSHQPLEGPFSWYEAHLVSEEGMNILGSTLPGFLTIGHGVNQNLAWAHTVNYPDFVDVYKLKINPENPLQYEFDGKWETLVERKTKIKVKIGPFKFGKKFTFYWSKYGATLKMKDDYYSIRLAGNMGIKAPEQQYCMAKAKSFEEFKKVLELQYIPSFNLVYADREDNIFYLNNGLIPYRNPSYNWRNVLAGNTSKTLWKKEFHPLSELPQVLNPSSGYVFNTNNTPFNATGKSDNLNPKNYDETMGHIPFDNNRSLRMQELFAKYDKLTYQDFKRIKYDLTYPSKMYYYNAINLEELFSLDANKYPDVKDYIEALKKWDRKNSKESIEASIFVLFWHFIKGKLKKEQRNFYKNTLTEAEMIEGLQFAKKHLKKYFGKTQVPLGDLQRHVKGKKDLPLQGGFDVIAAIHSEPHKKGRFKAVQGESYISLIRFSDNGVELETVNAYGTSNNSKSPHYTDQMELYTQQKLKKMTFDKKEIFKNAEKVYHPE